MTEQYQQDDINQIGFVPVNVTTPDASVLDVVLGTLSINNTTMTVNPQGGGSAPSDVAGHAYSAGGNAVAVRDGAGVLSVPFQSIPANGAGTPSLDIVTVGNDVVLRITPADGVAMNHRLKMILGVF